MSSETMRRVRVVGFGNRTAGDLAVGLIAAAWAREELRHDPSVEVIEASPGIRALDLFENAEAPWRRFTLQAFSGSRGGWSGRSPGPIGSKRT